MPSVLRDNVGRKMSVVTEHDEKERMLDLSAMNLTPPDVGVFDEPTRCYRLNNEWAKIVMGIVSWLAATPVWQDAENEGYSAIEEILNFMVGYDCIPQLRVRQNPLNPCILESSPDAGNTWDVFADLSLCQSDGGNDYFIQVNINQIQINQFLEMYIIDDQRSINIYGPLIIWNGTDGGTPDADRETALCMAAQAYVDSYAARKVQELDFAALGIFAVGILTGIITGPVGLIAGIAIGGSFLVGGLTYTTARNALTDINAIRDVACCMKDGLMGETVDQASFQASLDSCGFGAGTNQAIVRDLVADSFSELESYLAFIDATGRAFVQVDIFGQDDCFCGDDTFMHTFDFTIDDGDWENMAADNRPYGEWEVGVGWKSVWGGAGQGIPDAERLYIKREGWADRHITKVQAYYTSTGTTDGTNSDQKLQFRLDDVNITIINWGGFIVPNTWMEQWTGNHLIDEIWNVTNDDPSTDTDEIVCTKIIVWGDGTDPF